PISLFGALSLAPPIATIAANRKRISWPRILNSTGRAVSMANATTLDEELFAGLQQARKKKARNYCLIAKGPEVLKLIVQKKKIPAGVVQKAKAEVKGNNIIEGVVFGEGVSLTFEVLDSE